MKLGRTVLIVAGYEPSHSFQSILSTIEGAGFRVLIAPHLSDAYELVESELPHLVILMGDQNWTSILPIPTLSLLTTQESSSPKPHLVHPFQSQKLIQKMRELIQSHMLSSIKFSESESLEACLCAKGWMPSSHEAGFFLAGPFKIAPNEKVLIQSRFLQKLKLDTCQFRRSHQEAKLVENQLFYNDIVVIGVSAEQTRGIKSI